MKRQSKAAGSGNNFGTEGDGGTTLLENRKKEIKTKNRGLLHLFRRSALTKENAFLLSCTPIALCTKTISASSGFTLSFHDPFP